MEDRQVERAVIRAQENEVLFALPDHVEHVGGVPIAAPLLARWEPRAARAIGEALIKQAEAAERAQGSRIIEAGSVGHVQLRQLPPYPEGKDRQLQHLEAKREVLLNADEAEILRIWRHETRKKTI